MSAYVFVASADKQAAYLFSDGAAYPDSGIIAGLPQKTKTAKNVPFAITAVGHQQAADMVKAFLCDQADKFGVDRFFSDVLPIFVESLKESYASADNSQHIAIVIASYSEKLGAFRVNFQTFDEIREDGARAFEITIDNSPNARGSHFPAERLISIRWPEPGEDPEAYFAYYGAAVIGIMREYPGLPVHMTAGEHEPFYLVGGHVDMTIVDAAGARTKRVHTWPDRVGERIEPFAHLSAAHAGNRRQRRAMAASGVAA